jgi:glycopeptide antibiotics resistance protein
MRHCHPERSERTHVVDIFRIFFPMIRTLLIRYSTAMLVVASLVIIYGTLFPAEMIVKSELWSFDKIIHMVGFGGLTGLIWLHMKRTGSTGRALDIWALIWGIGAGALIEILQYLMPVNRSAEWGDLLADAAGSILAVLILRIFRFDKRKKDRR